LAQTVIQKKRFQAVNLLMGAVKNFRYYPPTSDMAVGSLDRAYTSLMETLDQTGPVVFTVSKGHLNISGCPLTEKEQQFPHIRFLVEIMSYWGIRRITFERGLPKKDLIRFLADFKKTPDEIESEGGRKKRISDLPSPHILLESSHLTGSSPENSDSTDNAVEMISEGVSPPILPQETEPDSIAPEKAERTDLIRKHSAELGDEMSEIFANSELLSMIPEIIVHRILEGKEPSAIALLRTAARGLAAQDPEIREAAAHVVSRTGARLTVENRYDFFLEALPDLIRWIRIQTLLSPSVKEACRQLQQAASHFIHSRRYESALSSLEALHALSDLEDPNDGLSTFSHEMLKTVAEPETLRILSDDALKSGPPDSDLAGRCLILLGVYSGIWLLDLLAGASERTQRIRIMTIVSEIGRPLLSAIQKKLTPDNPWYFLRNLTLLLGKFGDETHVERVIPLLEHPDIRVRREALNTLYNIGGPRRRNLLLSALASAEDQLKTPIVIMLGGLRHPEAVEPLLELLKTRPLIPTQARTQLEEAVCKALGRIGESHALPFLKEILEPKGIKRMASYGESVKAAAKEAVETIEKQQAHLEKEASMETPQDRLAFSDSSKPAGNALSEIENHVDACIRQGNKAAAISFLLQRVEKAALEKRFPEAEALLEKMSEVDPMALSEIYIAGELIEREKTASLDKDRMASWGGLYDGLTQEETHAFYFALTERMEEGNVVLIQQGSRNDALFFIEQGELKVVCEKNQQVYLIKHLKGGDVAGTESFFNPTLSTVSVVTQSAVKLNILYRESLEQYKIKTPALENKLQSFCTDRNNITQTLLNKAIERRVYSRIPAEGMVTIQLFQPSGALSGKGFKGRLTDLSAGGLCFFIKLQNRESARMLLGRKLYLDFPLTVNGIQSPTQATGTVVAVHYHLSIDYSVHVRFDQPVNLEEV